MVTQFIKRNFLILIVIGIFLSSIFVVIRFKNCLQIDIEISKHMFVTQKIINDIYIHSDLNEIQNKTIIPRFQEILFENKKFQKRHAGQILEENLVKIEIIDEEIKNIIRFLQNNSTIDSDLKFKHLIKNINDKMNDNFKMPGQKRPGEKKFDKPLHDIHFFSSLIIVLFIFNVLAMIRVLFLKEKSQILLDRLTEAQEVANIGSWCMNMSLNRVYLSDNFYKLFGICTKTPLTYETFKKFVHPEDRPMVEKTYQNIIQERLNEHKLVYRIKKDDNIMYVEERGKHYFNKKGKHIKSNGTLQDITKQQLDKMELKKQEEIMIAQSQNAAMGEMIGMIAHQWRQPITVIAMSANNMLIDLELGDVNPKNIKDENENIVKLTDYLSKTINDFRNFFKPNKEKEEVYIDSLMEEMMNIIGKSLESCLIEVNIEKDEKIKIETFSRELLQVFINILKNSKEALIENTPKDRRIDIHVKEEDEFVNISFCDNGGGIKTSILEKIFNPYFSTKDAKVGTGLGLYMSKTIIEKHLNGSIEVFNTKEGACFKIKLPKLQS